MIGAIFINLPVEHLPRSVEFFAALGFTFNEQFTDETAACMIVNDTIYVMLMGHDKLAGFIDKPIASRDATEAILSLSCDSAETVRTLAETAFASGARKVNEFEDNGFMVSWGFEDLDGHLWDLFWMKPGAIDDVR